MLRPERADESSRRPDVDGRGPIRQRNGASDGAALDHRAEQPSATDAVERVIEAGQRLVTERIELAGLEAEDAITRAIGRAVFVVLMGVFAFSGWWAAMAAVIILLDQWLPLPASLAVVGGAHVFVGSGAILYTALRHRRHHAREGTSRA